VFKSITKKIKTISKSGLSAVEQGKYALENPTLHTENVAKKRLETCKKCEYFELEPIAFLRIKDKNIPELSQKYCRSCGCSLPYKTRQNIETCPKWNY